MSESRWEQLRRLTIVLATPPSLAEDPDDTRERSRLGAFSVRVVEEDYVRLAHAEINGASVFTTHLDGDSPVAELLSTARYLLNERIKADRATLKRRA